MIEPGKTGLLARPSYLDVGDLLNDAYDITEAGPGYIAPEDLDFSDLSELLTFREMMRLTTSQNPNAERPDRLVLLEAVLAAEGTLDSYVGLRYAVPVVTSQGFVPREIHSKARDLFVYELYRGKKLPDGVQERYDAAMKWVEDVGKGLAIIPSLQITDTEIINEREVGSFSVGVVDRPTDLFGSTRASNRRNGRPHGFDYPG